jgi:hypothetical protein
MVSYRMSATETHAMLEQVVDEFGSINVPALVEYLRAAHPDADPFKLAAQVISLIEAGPYTMGFEELAQGE